jgi:hypothetical protein
LKFASKKEVKDRLKEFDAPNLANYIDPDTIDKINAAHRNPKSLIKSKENKTKDKKDILRENRERIAKMKELYGMFVKMENAEAGSDMNSNYETKEIEEENDLHTNVLNKELNNIVGNSSAKISKINIKKEDLNFIREDGNSRMNGTQYIQSE